MKNLFNNLEKLALPFGLLLLQQACGGKDHPDFAKDIAHPAGSIEIRRFEVVPHQIHHGESATVIAEFAPGKGEVSPDVGHIQSGVPVPVRPQKDITYTLTVTIGKDRVVKRSATVKVLP